MRIAVDARYLRRPDVGISVYLRGLLDEMRAAGVALDLLTDDAAHACRLAEDHGARGVALPGRPGFAWEQTALPRWLRRERPDAVVAPANYGLPLAPVHGVRRIAVVHDLIPLRMPHLYRHEGVGWAAKYLLSIAITLGVADLVVCPSHATARDVRRVARGRPVVVRAPDLPSPPPGADRGRPAGWPERYVLYNGGRDARKNVPELLRAFALYRAGGGDHHLVLMGRGYEEHAGLIGALGVGDAVHMPGYAPEDAKWRGLRAAGAVAYPSRWEGFGLPMAEAFAAGVPVVAGTGGAQSEVGGDAALYVDVGDPASIAAGLRRALTPESRRRAREDGPRRLASIARPPGRDPLLAALAQPPPTDRSRR